MARLAPGGTQVMFFSPKQTIKEGQSIMDTVTFARAGTVPVPVTFAVGAFGADST